MTLTVVLHRDDVANGDNNRPWPLEFPDDARVGHVVTAFVRRRYLPEMPGCAWVVRQLAGEWTRDLALLVTLDHPKEPLVLRLGYSSGQEPLDVPRFRDAEGRFAFEARYHPNAGPLSFDAYERWSGG